LLSPRGSIFGVMFDDDTRASLPKSAPRALFQPRGLHALARSAVSPPSKTRCK